MSAGEKFVQLLICVVVFFGVVALILLATSRLRSRSGERIQFAGDSIERDQATVRTRLVTKAGTEIPVDYRMHRVAGDRWLAYDVAIEGVSMVANYRAQFNKIIQASGYPSLVSKLTEKQEQGLEADREPAIRKTSQTK